MAKFVKPSNPVTVTKAQAKKAAKLWSEGMKWEDLSEKMHLPCSPNTLRVYALKHVTKEMRESHERNDAKGGSLCWKCKKAYVGKGCEWADKFQPIDGWNAKADYRELNGEEKLFSYFVIDCPKFEAEEKRKLYTSKERDEILLNFWKTVDDDFDSFLSKVH